MEAGYDRRRPTERRREDNVGSVQQVSDGEFQAAVLDSKEPVVVDFFAAWCGPCKLIAPVLDQLSTTYAGKVKFVKVDIDDAPEVADKFAVNAVPTLLFIKGGQEADRMQGAAPKPMIDSWIQANV
jgi:thioredoxin 1